MESITTHLRGRVSIPDLMELPFRELHEYYRIVYLRAEAQAKAEKEREENERKQREEEERADRAKRGLPPQLRREPPPDAKIIANPDKSMSMPSPYGADDLEEMLEEMAEGGAI